jgi:hypothetical protein
LRGQVSRIISGGMLGYMTASRPVKLIVQAIEKFGLDLSGLNVLTEVGSGHYKYTPIIAALAGAAEVIAITGDSKCASAAEIEKEALMLAGRLGIESKIKISAVKNRPLISRADIVTNLGFVRPIDKRFISHMKATAVVPLMFETWEFREADLDIEECRRKGICVLGTNEEDRRLRTFEYLGHLCAKILFDNQIEVFNSKLLIIGGGKFGDHVSTALKGMGADIFVLLNSNDIGAGLLQNLDAIITTAHDTDKSLIGEAGYIRAEDLKAHCPDVLVLNLAGNIERKALDDSGIRYLPADKARGHMGWTLSSLGPRPVIDLHAAGLKAGEVMARLRMSGHSPDATLRKALENPLCQGFNQVGVAKGINTTRRER